MWAYLGRDSIARFVIEGSTQYDMNVILFLGRPIAINAFAEFRYLLAPLHVGGFGVDDESNVLHNFALTILLTVHGDEIRQSGRPIAQARFRDVISRSLQ